MKVVSYYSVVPSQNRSEEKFNILKKFVIGVNAIGDTGILHDGYNIVDADVGVIQGWQHEAGKNSLHLRLRQSVIDTQILKNRFVCTADSNLFLFSNKSNAPHHYLRYSFNGIFPNSGIYFDNNPDPLRWQQIQTDTGIFLEDYKTTGKNILICLQRNGGWSMGKKTVITWLFETIEKIRKHSDRPIVIRPHPGDKKASYYLNSEMFKKISNVELSNFNTSFEQNLQNTWAVVNHNSSAIVGPIIQGYHAFITDPDKSQCSDVANIDFSKIENPNMFDRQKWLERISMFHWKFSELENGTAWRHMRNYCQ
jgi:hypothetical protein